MKKYIFVPITFILFLKLSFCADLWEIYQLGLKNDMVYCISKFDHESRMIDLPLAKSAFRPNFSVSGTVRQNMIGNEESSTEIKWNNGINFNVDLSIYNRSNKILINQTELKLAVSELQLEDAKHDLMLKVADRYFKLLASQDAREVARREQAAVRHQMALAVERLRVGIGTKTDLFDAKARLQRAQAEELKAKNLIYKNRASITEIIGTELVSITPLSDNAPLDFPYPNTVTKWIEKSKNNNLLLQMESFNREIAESEVEKQRQTGFPNVYIDAISNLSMNDMPNTNSVNLTVSMPFYQGGAIRLRRKKAETQYNLSLKRYQQSKRKVSTMITSEFLSINAKISQINALSKAIIASESALKSKKEGFSAGLTTNMEVLDAQSDLSRLRTDYLRARYDYILSVLRLERASGQLNEEDIKRVNGWLKSSTQKFIS